MMTYPQPTITDTTEVEYEVVECYSVWDPKDGYTYTDGLKMWRIIAAVSNDDPENEELHQIYHAVDIHSESKEEMEELADILRERWLKCRDFPPQGLKQRLHLRDQEDG